MFSAASLMASTSVSAMLSELWACTPEVIHNVFVCPFVCMSVCLSVCLSQCSMELRKRLMNWRGSWQPIRTVWSLCKCLSGVVPLKACLHGTISHTAHAAGAVQANHWSTGGICQYARSQLQSASRGLDVIEMGNPLDP